MDNDSEQPNRISPHLDNFILSPTALKIRPDAEISLAVLGTCQSEIFCCLLGTMPGIRAEQYGFSSGRHDAVPAGDWKKYDAVIASLSPRQLMNIPEEKYHDLSYVREWGDYKSVLDTLKTDLTAVINRIVDAIGNSGPIFFLSFFEPPATSRGILLNNRKASIYHLLRSLNDHMAETLEPLNNAFYIETNDVMSFYGSAAVADTYLTHFTHAGFQVSGSTDRVLRAIADRIRSALAILRFESPIKLIITDLDNTLWRGVLAEDEEMTVQERIEGWPLGYMEALLEFKRRGGLLAICSKNSEEAIRAKLPSFWQQAALLRIDDFCAVRINWNCKSQNIKEILAETNVLPTNTLFIDDSAREIHEVKSEFPTIRCLSGNPESWRSVILNSSETQVCFISSESARRSQLVETKQRRDTSAALLNRDDYLRSLQIRVKFDLIYNAGHPRFRRGVELLNKTNQFNTTGKRWGPADLDAHFADGGLLVALTAADSFGDNGLVALAVTVNNEILQVVLSCRMFGFSLESALLFKIIELMRNLNRDAKVVARFTATPLNNVCSTFYASHEFRDRADTPDIWESVVDVKWPAWIQRAE